ncbi:hypothetical protein [Mucilaginibacter sp.]|uniref:hypothetical protein n=1 Tax=Mucilaginibacter sp. TaxID=1882438 RepID=UPI003D0FB2B5
MLGNLYTINEGAGISINLDKQGNARIIACKVLIQKQQLTFEKKIIGLSSLEELKAQLPAKTLIALNLSGKGILQKQVAKLETIGPQEFSELLPNATLEDFYIQHLVSGKTSFVSIIRRTEADKWISRLKELGFVPLMLSLGPFPVNNILPQLNLYGNELVFDGHRVNRNEQQEWTSYTYEEEASAPFPIKAGLESLDEKLLTAYAAVFQLLLCTKLDPVIAEAPNLANALKATLEDKKLKVQGLFILGVFFILLLVNFLVFSGLNAANAKLDEQLSLSARSSSDLQQVQVNVQKKEALVKALGYEEGINKSSLIDQVASLLPEEISWQQAAIDPLDLSGSRSQKVLVFAERTIRINGSSDKIIPVNEWIARIKTKSWVKNVQLDSYTFNSELSTGQFSLTINY